MKKSLEGYDLIEKLYESSETMIYRAVQDQDNIPVIIKILNHNNPNQGDLNRFQREFEITQSIQADGVIHVKRFDNHLNTLIIVEEDIAGKSIDKLMEFRSVTLKESLIIGLRTAESLEHIHAAGVIHKNINPSNIIWNPKTWQVKVIDFGIASQLPIENPVLRNPAQLEGTLAYLSPEQTGRINRNIDFRSDLYSLGVALYEILTGQLPFTVTDAMESVHSHIAKKPSPLCEINSDIPLIVSDIVMKLLEKNAEDRYQSASGLRFDLEKLQGLFTSPSSLDEVRFELGLRDFSGKLQIPQKLYGRGVEIKTLLRTFNRVCSGNIEMMLVEGYSGVGKTALVHEVHKPMTAEHGYFASGKFEQFQRSAPYFAITQAFNQFCRYLLAENKDKFNEWKVKILDALGNNAQIIIDVIPDLEQVLGKQPAVIKLGFTEAQNRFNMFFLKFVNSLGNKDQPFILFIDDLQWIDPASLALLKTILLDDEIRHMLIIGAYRKNEVSSSHPFIMMVDELKKENAVIQTIHLANLEPEDIGHLLADSLMCDPKSGQLLTDLIYQKTQGNAFFTHRFLHTLYENRLLNFDFKKYQWQWDIEQIVAQEITDNVIDMLADKISRLPEQTSQLLQLASCIGNRFDLSLLVMIYDHDRNQTYSVLHTALSEGLIQPLDENYKYLETTKETSFKFSHDKIQQAAYAFVDDATKQKLHLKIGYLLLKNTPASDLGDCIFKIVSQLNKGANLIDNAQDIFNLAKLNYKAGEKAKLSAAFGPALHYFETAQSLLPSETWQTHYDFCFSTYFEVAECHYLNGNIRKTESMITILLKQSKLATLTVKVHILNSHKLHNEGEFEKALDVSIVALKLLGVDVPSTDSELQALTVLKMKEVEDLLESVEVTDWSQLPLMEDDTIQLTMQVLENAVNMSYNIGQRTVYAFSILAMVELTIRFGNTEESALGAINYAMLQIADYQDYETGALFDKRAYQLVSRFENDSIKAKINYWHAFMVNHWNNPLKTGIEVFKITCKQSLDTGNMVYGPFALLTLNFLRLCVGENLTEADQKIQRAISQIRQMKNSYVADLQDIGIIFIRTLDSEEQKTDVSTFFDNESALNKYSDNAIYLAWYHFWKCQALYFFGEYEAAFKLVQKFMDLFTTAFSGLFLSPIFLSYHSLCTLAVYHSLSDSEKKEALKKINKLQKQCKDWSQNCPENFSHQYCLVEAEKFRIIGQDMAAMIWYDKAITAAGKNGFIQWEALANELAAKFWIANGKNDFAMIYLREAHVLYDKWGATAKVRDLEVSYKQLVLSVSGISNTSAEVVSDSKISQVKTSIELDMESVMKASHILSEEIVLSSLLKKMMRVLIENAGATRGLFILEKEGQWAVEAEGTIDTAEVIISQVIQLEKSEQVPISLINYISRTQENVVLSNPVKQGGFTQDAYIRKRRPKSILGLPLLNHGTLIGILYLENNLTADTFTDERLHMINLLAFQAGISLRNARLFEEKQKYAEELTDEIFERRQVEEKLNISNKRYQNLFQNAPVPLWEEDFTGVFKYIDEHRAKSIHNFREYIDANPSFLEQCTQKVKILDVNQEALKLHQANTKGELLGNLDKIFTEKSFETFKEEVISLSEGFFEFESEGEVRTLSGEKRNIFLKMIIEKEIQGSFRALIATIDITDRNQMEERLKQAQKMESIGSLAGGIAHDFNNLLFPIIGMSEMLLEDLPEDSLEYENASEIFQAGKRAGDLVKQILAFSRQSEHKMTPVRVQNVLKEVLKLSRSTIPSNIEIDQDIQQNCGLVMADPTQIHQIAMNLITNASHAVENTNGIINIGLKELTLEKDDLSDSELQLGQYIRLSVSDNGIGMSQNIIQKIFEPYFTTKEKGKGTGLGLAVVYGIIKEHKGDIKVYSEVGKGTTFNIYLPLMEKSSDRIVIDRVFETVVGTENILLVDDEVSVAKLESQILSRLGYKVTKKTKSPEALNVFKMNPEKFDIVITDMTMPGMTGDQLAKEILSIKPNTPIIICTGFSERVDKEQAESLGVKGFLMKPVVKLDMAQMVRNVLDEVKNNDE